VAIPLTDKPEFEDLSLRERRQRYEEGRRAAPEADRDRPKARPDAPLCAVCADPIEAGRAKAGARTCAKVACGREWRERARRANYQRRRGLTVNDNGGPATPTAMNATAATLATEPAAVALEGPTEVANGKSAGRQNGQSSISAPSGALGGHITGSAAVLASRANGDNRLEPLFAALALAGANVNRLNVELHGVYLDITVTTNGRTTE
jgi:hypothetical protein